MRNPRVFPLPHGVTVRVHRGTRVKHGDTTYEYIHDLVGVAIAPRYSNEVTEVNRSGVIVGFSLFGPPGSDVQPNDRIEYPLGRFYSVQGEPAAWTSPLTGWDAGIEVALERVT